jgi:hypothetical protein
VRAKSPHGRMVLSKGGVKWPPIPAVGPPGTVDYLMHTKAQIPGPADYSPWSSEKAAKGGKISKTGQLRLLDQVCVDSQRLPGEFPLCLVP